MVRDHLNNEYEDLNEMCKEYEIPYALYYERLDRGWTQERALTTPPIKTRKCYDHLGNEYPDVNHMCDAYGITLNAYNGRRNRGWDLESALTMPRMPKSKNKCKDDPEPLQKATLDMLGNFTVEELLEAASLLKKRKEMISRAESNTENNVKGRKKSGPVPRPCMDHKGNRYRSVKEMCVAWNQNERLYRARIWDGWPISYALEKPKNDASVRDHLGHIYSSLPKMCNHYDLDIHEFAARINDGWMLKDALTLPSESLPKPEKKKSGGK